MSNLKTIAERVTIPHDAFVYASARLEQAFQSAMDGGEADSLAIVGPSRAGKTTVLQHFYNKHRPARERERNHVPVLFVSTPPSPSVKGLAGVMLDALEHPDPWHGTESQITTTLKRCIAGTGTKMLVIDEFQHFYDRGKRKVMHHVADWLKVVINETGTTLVVSGLPSCLAVIDQNEQLAGRLSSPIQLNRFRWDVPHDREQFISILGAYQDELETNHYDLPKLDSDSMAFRFWLATGGLMGYMAKLLRQVERNALGKQKKVITLGDFHIAHQQAIWAALRDPEALMPFSEHFKAMETIDLVRRASKIGEVIEEPEIPSRRGPSRIRHSSLNSVLVASR